MTLEIILLLLCLVAGAVLVLVLAPILIAWALACKIGDDCAGFLSSFTEEQRGCVFGCEHAVLSDDGTAFVCEVRGSPITSLSADEILSCAAFVPETDDDDEGDESASACADADSP